MMVHPKQDIPFLDRNRIDERDPLNRSLIVHCRLIRGGRCRSLVYDACIDISCPEIIYGAAIPCRLTCTPRTIDGKGQIVFCHPSAHLPVYSHLDIARTLRSRRCLLLEIKIARIIVDDECAVLIHDIAIQLVAEQPGVKKALPIL